MHIEFKRGRVSQLKLLEEQKGAADCQLDHQKVRLHRDLADKVADGDDILVAGKLQGELLRADALHNFSRGRIAQLDSSNYIIALGFGMFIGILCGVQSYHLFSIGDNNAGTGMVLASLVGFGGMLVIAQRVIEISKAASRVKFAVK